MVKVEQPAGGPSVLLQDVETGGQHGGITALLLQRRKGQDSCSLPLRDFLGTMAATVMAPPAAPPPLADPSPTTEAAKMGHSLPQHPGSSGLPRDPGLADDT